jgi:hypothetical protein
VITGFRHLDVQQQLPRLSSGQVSRDPAKFGEESTAK